MSESVINFYTPDRLKGIEPSKVKRFGFLKLRKKYEYSFHSRELFRKAVRENPEVPVRNLAGVTGVK